MFNKFISLALVGLLLNLALSSVAMANTETDAKFAKKVKTNIAKLGTGQDAKVEIKLKDGTKLKGYLSEANESSFVLIDESGISKEIPYPQVQQTKGKNSKTGQRILVVAIVVGLLVLISWGAARGN